MQRVQFMSYSEGDAVTGYGRNISPKIMRKEQNRSAKVGPVLPSKLAHWHTERSDRLAGWRRQREACAPSRDEMCGAGTSADYDDYEKSILCVWWRVVTCGKDRVMLSGRTYSRAKSDHLV